MADIKLNTIEEALEDFKKGKFVIVVDDEDRENEGDLICAAEKITPEINNLLDRLKCLVNWDTNAYHVENKIYEDKLEFTDGTISQWFPIYKNIADDLTKAIFEEDKKHIAELWECVINNI